MEDNSDCRSLSPFLSTVLGRLWWLLAFLPGLGSGAGALSATCPGLSLVDAKGIADAMHSANKSCWSCEQDESSLALSSALDSVFASTGIFVVAGKGA